MIRLLQILAAWAQLFLACHAYSFQTFATLEVLGAAKMNQIEQNVRDHLHGAGGVLSAGHTFASPVFTGNAVAVTAARDNNSTSVATTEYVVSQGSTQAEIEAITSTTTFLSPGRAHFHPGVCKAWAKADFAGALQASYNMTSVTDTDTGVQTFTIATDLSGVEFCTVATNESAQSRYPRVDDNPAAGSVVIVTNSPTPANADASHTSVAIFGDI